jgi:hypothetical protein
MDVVAVAASFVGSESTLLVVTRTELDSACTAGGALTVTARFAVAPALIAPTSQVTRPAEWEQPALAETNVTPAGRAWTRSTSAASPGPVFWAESVYASAPDVFTGSGASASPATTSTGRSGAAATVVAAAAVSSEASGSGVDVETTASSATTPVTVGSRTMSTVATPPGASVPASQSTISRPGS